MALQSINLKYNYTFQQNIPFMENIYNKLST